MKPSLQVGHYISSEIFEQEQFRLFGRLWIFACLRTAISGENAFATRRIAGRSVLIQNSGGRIRAFENACPHRLMPLQTAAFGQARMVCPYHGWVFDNAGKVKSIPKEQSLYAFPHDEREALCLREYAVETLGELVFVNLDENPIPITEQFSSALIERLETISAHFSEVSVHTEIPVRYNWKLNFENVLDHQHVPYVHPRTFLPLMRLANDDKSQKSEPSKHPTSSDLLIDQSWASSSPIQIESWPWHAQVNRYGPEGTYYNHFLFPNVNFISVDGLVFLIQQFEPVSAKESRVIFTLCSARSRVRMPALPAILRGHMKSEVEVLMEDVHYLESLQAALHASSPAVHHGQYEHRLVSFGQAYLRWMEAERPC
jgi:phenylpropionate dioxygenase-like ring-hydroxylating dioxygenase large terminal subunit